MRIETPRLLLRPWQSADAEELFRLARDPAVGPMAGWPPHANVRQSRSYLRIVLLRPETYAICRREAEEGPIGNIAIRFAGEGSAPLGKGEAEIGYWIGRSHWGQGFATEALEAALARAFTALGCPAVWCGYFDGNEASRRVQEKSGLRYRLTEPALYCRLLGETRTEHFMCITRKEWEAARPQRP